MSRDWSAKRRVVFAGTFERRLNVVGTALW
jgi:hypothetical protein